MTRVAGANPRIWVDIFLDNREALAAALREHRRAADERASRRSRAATPATWRAGSARRRAAGAGALASQFDSRPRGPLRRARARARPPRRRSRASRRRSARRASTSRTSSCTTSRPSAAATIELIVGGADAAAEAVAHARRAGLRRRSPRPSSRPRHERAQRRSPADRARGRAARRSHAANGDKSVVATASLLLGALADGPVEIAGFGANADTLATLRRRCRWARACRLDEARTSLRVHGVGLRGLQPPDGAIDVHNAGTLLRLLPGLLAGQPGARSRSTATSRSAAGPSIASSTPLRRMGVMSRTATASRRCTCAAGARCSRITYELPVASAQVKSCVLLAGLLAESGRPRSSSRTPTRDHTERMLAAAGVRVERQPGPRLGPARRALRAAARRGAGRHLVGRAVHRRRDAAAGVAPVPAQRRRQPGAHRPADRAGAHGRAHRALQPARHRGRRAGRRPRGAARGAGRRPRSSPRSCRRWSTSCR